MSLFTSQTLVDKNDSMTLDKQSTTHGAKEKSNKSGSEAKTVNNNLAPKRNVQRQSAIKQTGKQRSVHRGN